MDPISVVITNYNGVAELRAFLPQIIANLQELPCVEYIVVDDGSSDDSVAWLDSALPDVKVVGLSENSGFASTANAGFEAATHEFVLLLSSDMVIDTQAVRMMWSSLCVCPEALCVSGPQIDHHGNLICGRFVGQFFRGLIRVRPHPVQPGYDPAKPQVYHQFQAAVGLYRRSHFLSLSGFCLLFLPLYFEEVDLCYRAWKRGLRVLYHPGAVISHHHLHGAIIKHYSKDARKSLHRLHQFIMFWKNVDTRGFLVRHLAWISMRFAFSWIYGDWTFYKALMFLVRHRGDLAAQRQRLINDAVLSDPAVLEISSSSEGIAVS